MTIGYIDIEVIQKQQHVLYFRRETAKEGKKIFITAGDCPWLGPKRPNPAGEARYEPDIVDWYNCI